MFQGGSPLIGEVLPCRPTALVNTRVDSPLSLTLPGVQNLSNVPNLPQGECSLTPLGVRWRYSPQAPTLPLTSPRLQPLLNSPCVYIYIYICMYISIYPESVRCMEMSQQPENSWVKLLLPTQSPKPPQL